MAFEEDLGLDPSSAWTAEQALARDLSTYSTVEAEARGRATLVAKGEGVLCGLDAFERSFELLDPGVRVVRLASDGDSVESRQELATVEGSARALLTGERTALNVLQRLSGTATATAALVRAARAGSTGVRVLDTRKTTPGLRRLERYAVRCGGGENHRYGLDDEVMLKDNHLDLARDEGLADLVRRSRAAVGSEVRITAEARDIDEATAALEAGADVLLLDNFTPEALAGVCRQLRDRADSLGRRVELEASGGIDVTTAEAYAASGVDRLSVGAPTHSAPALDLSLRLEPVA